jgi:hypothetical protein
MSDKGILRNRLNNQRYMEELSDALSRFETDYIEVKATAFAEIKEWLNEALADFPKTFVVKAAINGITGNRIFAYDTLEIDAWRIKWFGE